MPGDSAAERAFYFCALSIARAIYRVKVLGRENLPTGGCLIVPNHITWVDAIILQLACPRPVRFIIDEEFYRKPALQPVLRMARAIPIDRRKPREAVRRASEQIEAGQFVCIFPEGQLSRTGTLARLQRGFEMIARHAQAPVVPVFLDQLWGSIFSFRGGKFFRKWPRHFPYRATVDFGVPLSAEEATIPRVHEDLLKLARIASAHCASCSSRPQALAFRHARHRWNGWQQVEPRKTARSFDRAQSSPSKNNLGETGRDCITGQQRRSRCQSRGDIGRQSSRRIEFHGFR